MIKKGTPMTTVVLLRHGQSLGNIYSVFLGHTDLGLTDLGRRQAEKAAVYLDRYKFDAIYTSDLLRTTETAAPVALRQGLTPKEESDLREVYAGVWEKLGFEEIKRRFPETYAIWKNDIGHATPTGGESVLAMAERVYLAFDRIVKENEGKTVLIVTHATPVRLLTCRFLRRDPSFAGTVSWSPNASITAVTVDGDSYNILLRGEDSFLGEDATAVASIV